MVPQLYINYKLKSVAHMPWRGEEGGGRGFRADILKPAMTTPSSVYVVAMVYKSLNTFIDDLFAFVVRMPWMHRIACLVRYDCSRVLLVL